MKPHLAAPICVLLIASSAAVGNSAGRAGGASSAGAGAAAQGAKASSAVASAHRGIGRLREGFRGDSAKAGEICRYNAKTCYQLVALRSAGLKARREDGGNLTPEHLADLQIKLDQLLAQAQ